MVSSYTPTISTGLSSLKAADTAPAVTLPFRSPAHHTTLQYMHTCTGRS